MDPPQIPATVNVRRVFRFTSTSGAVTDITPKDLMGLAGSMGTVVNSLVDDIASLARLHRVSIWTPPSAQGAASTCSIQWYDSLGSIAGPEVTDITNSVSRPAHVSSAPPRGTLASFWVSDATTPLMSLVAPAGSVIDVEATLVLNNTGAAVASQAVASAVVGVMYWLSLDQTAGTQHYVPVGLPTTH